MAIVAITNEPVRGYIPPAWFSGLSGLEQMRAWSSGLLGAPPPTRLTGSRCTHVGPGFATCVMPAAEMLTAPGGHIEIWPLVADALGCAQQTAVGAGQTAQPLTMATNHFRPARPGTGNLTARARVLNASSFLVYAEAQVEDNEGRQIASCGGHARIIALEPKPPSPPEQIEPIEEPRWATPDPWERAPAEALSPHFWDNHAEIVSAVAGGRMPGPLASLLGIAIEDMKSDRLVATMPASEWFCAIGAQRTVAPGFLAAILNNTGWLFGRMEIPEALIGLDTAIRFFRPVVADGRPIRAEAQNGRGGDNYSVVEVTLFDADGKAIATSNGSAVRLDGARRGRARRRTSERQLCTVLFTDIVSSTERAKAVGDAAWSALREQHDEIARQQIAFCSGLLVKSTGDGLLARFGSPARGMECARRLRDALARLGLQIRSGLHAGECEITEDDVVGAAVNLAARIQTAAEPGEILVSSTMRDLTAGANLKFEDRGELLLKGFDEPWRLWALKA